MTDISMQYLGMKLSGPIVVASTPLSESIDNIRHMEDAGASAIVLTSLFEEQLALESRTLDEDLSRGTDSFAESLGLSARTGRLPHDARGISGASAARAGGGGIPIIASLNGATTGGWVRFAREMEQAGASAIELNTFALATDRSQTSARARAATAGTRGERVQGGEGSGCGEAFAIVYQPAAPVRAA